MSLRKHNQTQKPLGRVGRANAARCWSASVQISQMSPEVQRLKRALDLMKMSFVCNVVNYFNKNIILIPSVGRGLSTKFGATTKIIFKETLKIEILIWEI